MKFEEGRPEDGVTRRENPRRDDGRDGIRCIVQAFRKSKNSATAMRKIRSVTAADLDVLNHDTADLVRHVLEPVHDLFQVIVQFGAHHEGHRILAGAWNRALRPASCRSFRAPSNWMTRSVRAFRAVAFSLSERSFGKASPPPRPPPG